MVNTALAINELIVIHSSVETDVTYTPLSNYDDVRFIHFTPFKTTWLFLLYNLLIYINKNLV